MPFRSLIQQLSGNASSDSWSLKMTTNKKPPFSDAEVIRMYKAMRCTALSRDEYINTLDETERDILLISAQCCKMIIANAEYWINRMAEEDK